MAQQAIGMIETKGLIGMPSRRLDAALKAANVKFVRQDKVGSGMVAVTRRRRCRRGEGRRGRRRGSRAARG